MPNTFSSGEQVDAAKFNANFEHLADRSWDVSSSNLFYSDGNVGIGTSSPAYNLDIVTDVNGMRAGYDETAGFTFRIKGGGSGGGANNVFQFIRDSDSTLLLALGVGDTNKGNVGIGTTSPGRPLTIKADTNSYHMGFLDNTGIERAQIYGSSSLIYLVGKAGVGIHLAVNATQDGIIINPDGNVGIGTTSPGAGSKLHIVGEVRIDDLSTGSNPGVDLCYDASNHLCQCGLCQ